MGSSGVNADTASLYGDAQQTYAAGMERAMESVQKGLTPILVGGGIVTLVLALLWLLAMSHCAGPIVWVTILMFFTVFACGAYVSGCNGYNWGGCAVLPTP